MAKDDKDPAAPAEEAPLRSIEEAVEGKLSEIAEQEEAQEEEGKKEERRESRKRREFTTAALERIKSEYRLDVSGLAPERIVVEPYEDRDDLFTLTITFGESRVKLAKPYSPKAIARLENKTQWVATYQKQGQPPRQSRPTDFVSAVTFATTGKEIQ